MNKFLAQYAWEIMDLGKENHVDNATARAMFCENLSTYGTEAFPNYPGANVDYAALSAQWQAMSEQEQGDAKIACANLMQDCYEDLSKARRENDMGAYYRIILNYEAPEQEKPNYILYTHAWDIWDKAEADGTDLVTAQKDYVETLEGWGNLSEAQQADEAAWFALKVAPYDKGLQYTRLTEDRALFEAVLASR